MLLCTFHVAANLFCTFHPVPHSLYLRIHHLGKLSGLHANLEQAVNLVIMMKIGIC